jgi:hypothetical protein
MQPLSWRSNEVPCADRGGVAVWVRSLRIWGYVLKAISTDCPHLAARFPAKRVEPSVEQKPCCFQDFHWHRVGRFEFHCPAVVHFASAAANRLRNTPARITLTLCETSICRR